MPCTLSCEKLYVFQFSMGGLDMPFEDIKGSLNNWVNTKSIQLEIKRRFRGFLEAYKDDADELIYRKRVKDMCIGKHTNQWKLAATETIQVSRQHPVMSKQ